MISKFPGTCKGCGARFAEGDAIDWRKGQGVVSCPACATGAANGAPVQYKGGTAGPGLVLPADVTSTALLIMPERPSWLVLDAHQQAVVDWREGAALVAAGAGSGKSTVLIERAAMLVGEGVMPESIVILVYNRKAADDLRSKLTERVGEGVAARIGAFTFHGWAQRLLRRWGHPHAGVVVGADEDSPSPYTLANGVMRAQNLQGEADGYIAASGFIREALIDLDAEDAVKKIAELRVSGGSDILAAELRRFTIDYQKAKQARGCIDFADMLYLVGHEIEQKTARAMVLTNAYAHVMVDEAQDANVARNVIGWHLGSAAKSFIAVGDLRQSIYGFTGARPDMFAGMQDRATLLTLPVNRRSTSAIVTGGNVISDGRDWNLGGACEPKPGTEGGEPIHFWDIETPSDEGGQIASDIQARIAAGLPLMDAANKSNYACLVRTNAGAAELEVVLMSRGLPVRVLGSTGGVWATNTGRHMLAYLAGAEGKVESGLSAIANRPLRYIKGDTIRSVAEMVKNGQNLLAVLRAAGRGPARLADDFGYLGDLPWKERCAEAANLLKQDLAERAAEAGAVAGRAVNPDEDKVKAYEALAEAAVTLGGVQGIHDQINAAKAVGNGPAVEISTCHKAKGAEWTVVYTTGVCNGVFPHEKAEDIEEERRLFYVAVTRAKKVAIVSTGGRASEFFDTLRDASPKSPPPEGGPDGEDAEHGITEAGTPVRTNAQARALERLEGYVDDDPVNLASHVAAFTFDQPFNAIKGLPSTEGLPNLTQREVGSGIGFNFTPTTWAEVRKVATAKTAAEPQAEAGEGGRYVEVALTEIEALLAPLGFVEATPEVSARVGQTVLEAKMPTVQGVGLIRVYTTIPVAGAEARPVGEDSMKVVGLWHHADDVEPRPLHKKLPYACRTRGWRVTLLARIEEVAAKFGAKVCNRCGAPLVERKSMRGDGAKFWGCVRFGACKQGKVG